MQLNQRTNNNKQQQAHSTKTNNTDKQDNGYKARLPLIFIVQNNYKTNA